MLGNKSLAAIIRYSIFIPLFVQPVFTDTQTTNPVLLHVTYHHHKQQIYKTLQTPVKYQHNNSQKVIIIPFNMFLTSVHVIHSSCTPPATMVQNLSHYVGGALHGRCRSEAQSRSKERQKHDAWVDLHISLSHCNPFSQRARLIQSIFFIYEPPYYPT